MRWDFIDAICIAVVEEILVEWNLMIGVKFDRDNFRVARICIPCPTIYAIPALTHSTAVIKDDLSGYG